MVSSIPGANPHFPTCPSGDPSIAIAGCIAVCSVWLPQAGCLPPASTPAHAISICCSFHQHEGTGRRGGGGGGTVGGVDHLLYRPSDIVNSAVGTLEMSLHSKAALERKGRWLECLRSI